MANRRFADFYEGALPFQMSSIPEGGMCLSVFLVLWKSNRHRVLLGKVNKDHDWISLGALSNESAEKASTKWMLPSSHLLLYESPNNAALRVLKEQISIQDSIMLRGPEVFSEIYDVPKLQIKDHWDVEFVYTGELFGEIPKNNPAWAELGFQDVAKLGDSKFARNHQDILVELGVR